MLNFMAFMKNIPYVFSTFKVSLLSFSHVFTLSNSLLLTLIGFEKESPRD